jgi:hypothetical protein
MFQLAARASYTEKKMKKPGTIAYPGLHIELVHLLDHQLLSVFEVYAFYT